MTKVRIREITATDDFHEIIRLINDTLHRFIYIPLMRYGVTSEDLKRKYIDSEGSKGFIAEDENKIVAFMGVTFSKVTKNGLLECGFVENFPTAPLQKMTEYCSEIIRDLGGTKLFRFANTQFGQVRNREITLWEQMGFISDEFTSVTAFLSLNNWKEPVEYNNNGIEPTAIMEFHTIQQILLEDGEDVMAELVGNVYDKKRTPDEIVLTLRDKKASEISGIAYYRVNIHDKGTSKEFQASAFGLHFRPMFEVSSEMKKRLLHAALLSMKQLNVQSVATRMTLKHFDVFSALVSEGFNNHNLENANIIRLQKPISPI